MSRRRILIAYDGTEQSFWALQQAADAAQDPDVEIGIVTVMPKIVDAPADALRYLRERGLDATVHTPVGDAAVEIARVVGEEGYHAVYLGTREGSVGRGLTPSVSRKVSLHAPVTVVIAR